MPFTWELSDEEEITEYLKILFQMALIEYLTKFDKNSLKNVIIFLLTYCIVY